jgi:hypothetical protein
MLLVHGKGWVPQSTGLVCSGWFELWIKLVRVQCCTKAAWTDGISQLRSPSRAHCQKEFHSKGLEKGKAASKWTFPIFFLHCYKSWGLIPPAWLDDTILNLQANGIYFRDVYWVKTSSLSDFSDDIGHFRWYRTVPKNFPSLPRLATKWHLYFKHDIDAYTDTRLIRTRSSLNWLLRSYLCTTGASWSVI